MQRTPDFTNTDTLNPQPPAPKRRRVWWLTLDLHNVGTETYLYASEDHLHNNLAAIMEEEIEDLSERHHLDPDDKRPEAAAEIERLIAEGKIEEAWEIFDEGLPDDWRSALKHPDDMYWWGHEDLEFTE